VNYSQAERVAAWQACTKACEELSDDFNEVLEKDQMAARLQML
jgi:hypothetical protein